MGAGIAKYYTVLGNLSEQGFLGPGPSELRSASVFLGVFVLLTGLPLLMRKARKWRAVLMAFPVYWLTVALFAVWSVQQSQRLPNGVGNAIGILLMLYCGQGVACIVFNKGYRWETFGLVAVNVYIALFTSFVSALAITGGSL